VQCRYYYDRATNTTKWELNEQEGKGSTSIADVEARIGTLGDVLAMASAAAGQVETASEASSIPPADDLQDEPAIKLLSYLEDGGHRAMGFFDSLFFAGDQHAPDLPWQLTRIAIITVAAVWSYMLLMTMIEAGLGPASALKPPGEPPWIRDQKRRHAEAGWVHLSNEPLRGDYRLHSASSTAHYSGGAGHGRRLAVGAAGGKRSDVAAVALQDLSKVLQKVRQLADVHEGQGPAHGGGEPGGYFPQLRAMNSAEKPPTTTAVARPDFLAPPAPLAERVSWPAFFEPQHLACRPRTDGSSATDIVALTPRGFAAMATVGGSEDLDAAWTKARPFALSGIGDFGPLAGATWTRQGLLVVTRSGRLLQCPGSAPADSGEWACEEDPAVRLPLPAGAQLLSAAVAAPGGGGGVSLAGRLVALVDSSLPRAVLLFREEGRGAAWSQAGEVHLPPGGRGDGHARVGASDSELLVVFGDGEVHRRPLRDGRAAAHPAPAGTPSHEYQAACALPSGGLVRLALRQTGKNADSAWVPEVFKTA